ncbi:MAG: response regulator [Acidobacteriota bacterium]
MARILIVDDNAVCLMVAAHMVRTLGHETVLTDNAPDALRLFTDSLAVDLVLMDWRMPEVDGVQATRRLRQLEVEDGTPRVPIIAMSASAMDVDRRRYLEAGMDDLLAKPLTPKTTREILEIWLERPRSPILNPSRLSRVEHTPG